MNTVRIKIGMAQLLVEGGEPERNLSRAEILVQEAAAKSCDIVILPETIDFAWTHPSVFDEALPIPGKYSDFFCKLAKQYNLFICVGLTERNCDKLYNTAVLINNNGEIILKHSKINLLEVEHPFYEVGHNISVVDTKFGKIGLNICADNYQDALSIGHTIGRMGAQILLSPSSWTVDYSITEEVDPYNDKWEKPLSSLASLFNMLVISTTSVGYIVGGPYEGKKMVGCSIAVDKTGILTKGQFNEFAGELIVVESDVPQKSMKGTQISDFLRSQGISYFPKNS
jgi:predicted amidohydrolase